MTNTPFLPAMTSSQSETFANMVRDVALFDQQQALTDRILADHRRAELTAHDDSSQVLYTD
jgi:hypothetical protein